ncbi:MAG: hypothetical protein Q8869_03015, partial [Candidatus Phytoplasma australasiaticum]|nr:hypothetical protein [Candidatus Phytoplasma australasiaticum]
MLKMMNFLKAGEVKYGRILTGILLHKLKRKAVNEPNEDLELSADDLSDHFKSVSAIEAERAKKKKRTRAPSPIKADKKKKSVESLSVEEAAEEEEEEAPLIKRSKRSVRQTEEDTVPIKKLVSPKKKLTGIVLREPNEPRRRLVKGPKPTAGKATKEPVTDISKPK